MFDPGTSRALRASLPDELEGVALLVAAARAGSGGSLVAFLQACCELCLAPPAGVRDRSLLVRVVRCLVGAASWEDVEDMERELREPCATSVVADCASGVSGSSALNDLLALRGPRACSAPDPSQRRGQSRPITFERAGLGAAEYLSFVKSCIAKQETRTRTAL